jgi:hypothetical protein
LANNNSIEKIKTKNGLSVNPCVFERGLDFMWKVKRQETAEHHERWWMTTNNELMDNLLTDYKKPEDLIWDNGLLKGLTKELVWRALQAEMAEHLGHAKREAVTNPAANVCNRKSTKRSKAILANGLSTSRATATPALSLRSWPSTKPDGQALTRGFCRCVREGCARLRCRQVANKWFSGSTNEPFTLR